MSELSYNEKKALWGLIEYPYLNDTDLSLKMDIPYSTFCTVKKRLKDEGLYRTIQVPMLQRLGADILGVIYTLFNPAIPIEKRAEITTETIEIFDELFYSAGETHKGFSISLARNYGDIGRINDLRIETFARAGLLEKEHPVEIIFPFGISKIPRFFDFSPLLIKEMDLMEICQSEQGLVPDMEPVKLSRTEKKVMLGLIERPDTTDKALGEILGFSRHTVAKARKRLEAERVLLKKRIPDLEKLGFKVMTLSHLKFNPERPLDNELLFGDIMLNPETIFLAARKFECLMLSVYTEYEDYRADHTRRVQYLKEAGYLAELPNVAKYVIPNMVVMKDLVFGPIAGKILG